MSRPKKTIPTVYVNLGLPEDLMARVQLELYSELEGRVPHGTLPAFFELVLRQHFQRVDKEVLPSVLPS